MQTFEQDFVFQSSPTSSTTNPVPIRRKRYWTIWWSSLCNSMDQSLRRRLADKTI